jgi:secondary thiamine-phosphate synthase enzyme
VTFAVKTKGHGDVLDITGQVASAVEQSRTKDGLAVVFVRGSTAALTTLEYEEGVIEDLRETLEKLAPENADYRHHRRWGDRNGAAHIKSALIGTDLAVPIEDGRLALGAWQQIVLIDFDERPRTREVLVRILPA